MKKLSKEERDHRVTVRADLMERKQHINGLIEALNQIVDLKWSEISDEINALNETIMEVNDWVTEIHEQQEAYYWERSETWQNGDAGQRYQEWMIEWDCSLTTEYLDDPPGIEPLAVEAIDEIDNLSIEVPE